MTRVSDWMLRAGLNPDNVKRRALAGVIIGLTVVAIDRLLGMAS